jgi:3',5'-cyclic AMP phosphodiesterase CpdA
MARILVISDPHLSPTHGFFWANWRRACEMTKQLVPDAVIVSGDLCMNGADSEADIAFAARAMGDLASPAYAVPGNHDVGDDPPTEEVDQIIDERRLQRWMSAFGADRFAVELGGWRVVGLNGQLLGSGLPQESEQDAWLDAELARGPQPIMLVLHKPLFQHLADETELTRMSVKPEPRARLMRRLRAAPVRLVVSGHRHCHRDVVCDGVRYVWAPSPAFQATTPPEGAVAIPGLLAIELDGEAARVDLVEVPGLVAYDLAELKGHGRYTRLLDMPPCPPEL